MLTAKTMLHMAASPPNSRLHRTRVKARITAATAVSGSPIRSAVHSTVICRAMRSPVGVQTR